MKPQSSLRQKITLGYLGYYVMALLIVALSLFTFLELRLIDNKVTLGEHISELFDATLEIRRFEKNYFLYRQEADLLESRRYALKAIDLIESNTADFARLASAPRFSELSNDIRSYLALMDEYAGAGAVDARKTELLDARIRKAGKDVVTVAEEIAGTERRKIRASLDRFRFILLSSIVLISLLMIAVGWALSRMVARPLKHMDSCVEAVSSGRLDRIVSPSEDREIISITQAFNRMLDELERRQKMLLRSEKLASLGTMLAGVAHELNNPLSNTYLMTQILLEEVEENDAARRKEQLQQVEEQTVRARNIVRDLLDFARDKPLKRENVLLAPLIDETILFLRRETASDVQIVTEIAADIVIPADRQRLERAFLNLIKNALEAVDEAGEIHISAVRRHPDREAAVPRSGKGGKSHANCLQTSEAVDIEIRDSGPGIPAEILPRIFDPFFTTKDVGRGMGLGLFIAHGIIEEHGGCISAESEAGRGTAFHIRLPLESVAEAIT